MTEQGACKQSAQEIGNDGSESSVTQADASPPVVAGPSVTGGGALPGTGNHLFERISARAHEATVAGRAPNITPAILRFATVGNLTFATGLVAGGIFFYNRAYSAKFLRDFGLSSGVIDMSPHDAIADGIEGVAAHVLWVVCGLALLVLLTYLCILVVQHFAVRLDRPGSAKPARAGAMGQLGLRIRTDPLFRWLLAATGVTVVTAFLVLLGIVVLGIPAEASADREAAAIKSAVVGRCDEFCSVYQMNGQSVRGFIIGSTPSRLFVWNDACKLSQIKLDDIVTVVPPGREAPSGRARQEPGRES